MRTLRMPSSDFVFAALRAGRSAGFAGVILLIARRLPDEIELELRRFWSDLDDMTDCDLLVLTTGLSVAPSQNTNDTYSLVYARGVGVMASSPQLSDAFERLLRVSAHVPYLCDESEAFQRRLISPQGVTEIRRALDIGEDALPALLVVDYHASTEYLVTIRDNDSGVSPTKVISALTENTKDVAHKCRALQSRLAVLRKLKSQEGQIAKRLRQVASEISFRKAALAAAKRRLLTALTAADGSTTAAAEEVMQYIDGHRTPRPIAAMARVLEHITRREGPGAPRFSRSLAILPDPDLAPLQLSQERLTQRWRSVKESLYPLQQAQLDDKLAEYRPRLQTFFRDAFSEAMKQLKFDQDPTLACTGIVGAKREVYASAKADQASQRLSERPKAGTYS